MQPPLGRPRPHLTRLARAVTCVTVTALAVLASPGVVGATPVSSTTAPAAAVTGAGAGRADVDPAVLAAVADGEDASFFVVLDSRADLSRAKSAKSHAAKAEAAWRSLRAHARTSQAPLVRFLDAQRVSYQPFWIANTVQVTGDRRLVEALTRRPDVDRIVPVQSHEIAAETAAASALAAEPVEWGVADIRADQVWEQYGNRGEGVVVANIDTGVQWNHPALRAAYRGWSGSAADHAYNFFDATNVCAPGIPCDDNGHGTHTIGTMVGSGGIGVAPGARWIAAKACAGRSCPDPALLTAGQWILAPTDRFGQNPRPDLAPHIVNNSWGGSAATFYGDILDAWHAAGIFESFSAGNDGNGVTCGTAKFPAIDGRAYAVGAYDVTGKIASFSGFGPAPDGTAKPDIAAPGVNVRSAWPGSGYNAINGTSMAAPHVAGAAALLWSGSPSLTGDIESTRAVLRSSARDVDDTHCGGTPDFNHVWGAGKLDALAAVDAAPHTAAVVTGVVSDQVTGQRLANVLVTATGSDTTRNAVSGADGTYRLTLPAGGYSVTATVYAYAAYAGTLDLAEGEHESSDVAMRPVPRHAVNGVVLDAQGSPLGGATVELPGVPVAGVTSAADGRFVLPDVAEGSFTVSTTPPVPALCNGATTTQLVVDGDEQLQVRLPERTDATGTTSCAPAAYSWIKGRTTVPVSGDEDAATVPLPFPVKFYGVSYSSLHVTSNGLVNFLSPRLGDFANTTLPAASQPNGLIAAYWDDLVVDSRASVQTAVTGKPGARRFAVVWNKVSLASSPGTRVTFQVVLDEATGAITLQYDDVAPSGASATVGVENQGGTDGLAYLFDRSALTSDSAIRFTQKEN